MISQPIRAVIFDIGMVLLRFDFDLSVQKFVKCCTAEPEKIPLLFFGSGLVDAYDRGKVTTQEFAETACKLIGFKNGCEELIEAWSDIFTPNQPMIERAHRWKKQGLPLYVISNTCEAHVNFFTAKYDFFQIFNGMILSYREGLLKPEPQIYKLALSRFGLTPETTLFIDDRLENILAARELKIQAIHYEDDFSLAENLKACGLE